VVRLKSHGFGQRESFWKRAKNLRGRGDAAFFRSERGQSLRKLRVALALAGVGRGEKLLGGGEIRGELSAVATVGAPSFDDGHAENECQGGGEKFWPELKRHKRCSNDKPERLQRLRSFGEPRPSLCSGQVGSPQDDNRIGSSASTAG